MIHIRIQPARVGAIGTILHFVAADKCHILHFSTGVGKFSRSQILHRQNGSISQLLHKPIHILRIVCIAEGIRSTGTQMGMGTSDKYSLGIRVHRLSNHSPCPVHKHLIKADDINAHDNNPSLAVVKSNRSCQQGIQDAISISGFIVACQGSPQRRCNINSSKTCFQHNISP